MKGSDTRGLIIVKLGGSLIETGRIGPILDIIAAATRPIAIVPGGGPFADAVRAAQKKFDFDDGTAHRMAILAMHQMAELFMAMQPRLVAAEGLADFNKISTKGGIPVWLPFRLADKDRRMPCDWTITADGFAARLAERLGAQSVVVVKSRKIADKSSLPGLVGEDVVDPVFAEIVTRACLDWHVLGPGDEVALARMINSM